MFSIAYRSRRAKAKTEKETVKKKAAPKKKVVKKKTAE